MAAPPLLDVMNQTRDVTTLYVEMKAHVGRAVAQASLARPVLV
jgi:hypothetical protein